MSETKLKDLVEYRYSYEKKVHVKYQTHLYGKPQAICEAKKRQLQQTQSFNTRFAIVPAGSTQYTLTLKRTRKIVH